VPCFKIFHVLSSQTGVLLYGKIEYFRMTVRMQNNTYLSNLKTCCGFHADSHCTAVTGIDSNGLLSYNMWARLILKALYSKDCFKTFKISADESKNKAVLEYFTLQTQILPGVPRNTILRPSLSKWCRGSAVYAKTRNVIACVATPGRIWGLGTFSPFLSFTPSPSMSRYVGL
jgi:hypothetical protein